MSIRGRWFRDEQGRALLLRGVNLGGSSKMPAVPDGATHLPTDFSDHRTVSFAGRPFPLAEADEHYARLRRWGFNALRFLVTWEAIEHAGPGDHDEAYLDYLYEVVRRAAAYDLLVFIDPHQDVWSRMSGGDGAPGWTLELAGFDLTRLDASEAAVTMQGRYPDYGTMVWSANRRRLASSTMFTLFFAGERLAPDCRVGDENIQSFLQRHYMDAVEAVAGRLAGLPHVLGYDTMNEPDGGYIGLPRLSDVRPLTNNGPLMTGFETMIVPAGFTRTVPQQERHGAALGQAGAVTLNPDGISAWRTPQADVWRRHGVWDVAAGGEPVLLRDDYFAAVDYAQDGLTPFLARFAAAVRRGHPGAIIFVEARPHIDDALAADITPPVVYAGHWYDSLTTRRKQYDPALALNPETGELIEGQAAVRQAYRDQLGLHMERARRDGLDGPVLIGEFGVPFDLDDGASFSTGDYSAQRQALSAYYDAIDAQLLHSTLWNYTSDNSNRWGDGWNGEDFSIFSRDQQDDPADNDSGGRAVAGFSRPTVQRCAGEPLAQRFDVGQGAYELRILADPLRNPTEVFVPARHYPAGIVTEVSEGQVVHERGDRLLAWFTDSSGEHTLRITPAPRTRGTPESPTEERHEND